MHLDQDANLFLRFLRIPFHRKDTHEFFYASSILLSISIHEKEDSLSESEAQRNVIWKYIEIRITSSKDNINFQ